MTALVSSQGPEAWLSRPENGVITTRMISGPDIWNDYRTHNGRSARVEESLWRQGTLQFSDARFFWRQPRRNAHEPCAWPQNRESYYDSSAQFHIRGPRRSALTCGRPTQSQVRSWLRAPSLYVWQLEALELDDGMAALKTGILAWQMPALLETMMYSRGTLTL